MADFNANGSIPTVWWCCCFIQKIYLDLGLAITEMPSSRVVPITSLPDALYTSKSLPVIPLSVLDLMMSQVNQHNWKLIHMYFLKKGDHFYVKFVNHHVHEPVRRQDKEKYHCSQWNKLFATDQINRPSPYIHWKLGLNRVPNFAEYRVFEAFLPSTDTGYLTKCKYF